MTHTAYYSTVFDAPIDAVWALIRDFGGLGDWHPGVVKCELLGGLRGMEIGAIRVLTLVDGAQVTERLVAFDEENRSFTYQIVESGLPVAEYSATTKCYTIVDGNKTFCEWYADFKVVGNNDSFKDTVKFDIFGAGLTGAKGKL